eukprot:2243604-Rhodomonas_salina.3
MDDRLNLKDANLSVAPRSPPREDRLKSGSPKATIGQFQAKYVVAQTVRTCDQAHIPARYPFATKTTKASMGHTFAFACLVLQRGKGGC